MESKKIFLAALFSTVVQITKAQALIPYCSAGMYSTYYGPSSTVSSCFACDAGKFSAKAGAVYDKSMSPSVDPCVSCNAAEFSLENTSCVAACPAGTSISSSAAKACEACADGQYATTAGLSKCLVCANGKFANYDVNENYGSTSCVASCAAGSSAVGTSSFGPSNYCAYCQSGFYSAAGSIGSCTACPSGKFSLLSASICDLVNCPAGSFADAANGNACVRCDAGKSAPAGSTKTTDCVTCPAGYYAPGGACVSCPAGLYVPSTNVGVNTCFQCNLNTFVAAPANNAAGATVCAACANNTASTFGSASCTLPAQPWAYVCPVGMYSLQKILTVDPQVLDCVSCADGKFSSAVGAIFFSATVPAGPDPCQSCAAGMFSVITSSGKYVGPSSCTASCPAGSYSQLIKDSTTVGSCKACAAGYISTAGTKDTCTVCSSSTYAVYTSDLIYGATTCVASCPAGTANFFACIACKPGTYAAAGAIGTCPSCASGKYSVAQAASCDLTSCPAGTFQVSNSQGPNMCGYCSFGKGLPAGTSLPVASGTDPCTTCSAGQYNTDGTVCNACSAGTFVPATYVGRPSCFQCFENTFSASGATTCTNCSPGTNSTKLAGSCSGPASSETKASCFSGDSLVTVASGASKFLSEVEIGDRVLTANSAGELSFAEVVFLPHGANDDIATFVELILASGKSIKATQMHLLKTCSGGLKYAQSLRVGGCLRTVEGDDAITSVSMTTAKGLYTAVTTNEFLVVNGIVASPFAVVHGVTHAYYNIHRTLYAVAPSTLKLPGLVTANALIGTTAALAYSLTASTN